MEARWLRRNRLEGESWVGGIRGSSRFLLRQPASLYLAPNGWEHVLSCSCPMWGPLQAVCGISDLLRLWNCFLYGVLLLGILTLQGKGSHVPSAHRLTQPPSVFDGSPNFIKILGDTSHPHPISLSLSLSSAQRTLSKQVNRGLWGHCEKFSLYLGETSHWLDPAWRKVLIGLPRVFFRIFKSVRPTCKIQEISYKTPDSMLFLK